MATKTGRPVKPDGERLDDTIILRLKSEEKAAIEKIAKEANQSVASWIRTVLLNSVPRMIWEGETDVKDQATGEEFMAGYIGGETGKYIVERYGTISLNSRGNVTYASVKVMGGIETGEGQDRFYAIQNLLTRLRGE